MKSIGLRAMLLAGLSAIAIGGPANAETLADAMVAAYNTSNLLDQNRAVLRAADEDVAASMASLRPVLSWVAEAGYAKTRTGEGDTASIGLALQMTLYDFGRSKLGTEIAKDSVLATREALVSVEQSLLLDAVQSYMNVRSAAENVSINQNSVRVIGEELKAAQDRFEVGDVTRTDVAQAEAALAAARASLASAQGELVVARESYRALTGVYPGVLAAPPKAPALPKSMDEARAIAMRTHPSILQAQHQVSASEKAVALAKANRLPTIGLSAAVDRNDYDLTTGSAGLQMKQTIYSGGALSSAQRKAMAQRDQAKAGLLQATVLVDQQVANAWANIAVTRAQIEAIDRQIRAATVAYRGVKEEASLGARTTLDVLDAEQNLLDAQAARIEAEAGQQVAIYSLLAAMGLLTVEHLKLGIPVYDPEAYYNAVKKGPASLQGQKLDRVLKAIGKD